MRVWGHQGLQFIPRVDAPGVSASLYQRGFGGVVLAEEDRLAQAFGEHHDKGQPEQGEETRFVCPEGIGEVRRALLARLIREPVRWRDGELQAEIRRLFEYPE